jgi:transcriptional regulator
MSVHAKGVLRFLNEAELLDVLKRTTAHFENDPHSPAQVEKMTDEYMAGNMKAIAAFEVEVTKLDAVFKLSQNRNEKDYDHIVHQLKGEGGEAAEVGKLMEERKAKVFGQ